MIWLILWFACGVVLFSWYLWAVLANRDKEIILEDLKVLALCLAFGPLALFWALKGVSDFIEENKNTVIFRWGKR